MYAECHSFESLYTECCGAKIMVQPYILTLLDGDNTLTLSQYGTGLEWAV